VKGDHGLLKKIEEQEAGPNDKPVGSIVIVDSGEVAQA
jgi:hypothetical protein